MGTQTQFLHRTVVQPTRQHDYLYDPNFTVSSDRDHARATFQAHTNAARVKRVPVYQKMFSELRHHQRFKVHIDMTDPVPKTIARQWRGVTNWTQIYSQETAGMKPVTQFHAADVTGRHRVKYFKRPIIPFLQQLPPDVLLASNRQDQHLMGDHSMHQMRRPATPLVSHMATQTDYRDSEAQTDPYTPEHVVRPGSQPELLTLATLSYGRGLPAGLAEVEMIERARAKRAWEASLPALNDMEQLEKRKKMMDEMERHEWALREKEIEKLQETRLQLLTQLLKQREKNHSDLNLKRLDKMWRKKQKEREKFLQLVRHQHIRSIRKLTKEKDNVEKEAPKRDITRDYVEPSSQTYAPMTRIGVFLDRNSENYNVKSRFINTYEGLLELEAFLPNNAFNPSIKAPKPKTVTKAGFIRRKYRKERELAEIHEQLVESKNKEVELPKPLRFLQKIEKPVPRPSTPHVEVPAEEAEEQELATIYIQKILRGRTIQNMMFEGKEKRMELIRELRSTHALQDAEQKVKEQEKQSVIALQRHRSLHDNQESYVDEAMSTMEGDCIGDALDFLSKELVRLQEERRIHAFSMLAERQRRIREAEESGKRQVEERRRREEDEIFKQIVKVHQNSVDSYLENIILESLDNTARQQASEEIQNLSERINDIAYDVERNGTQLQREEMVADLVHNFLIPEVHKQTFKTKVRSQQRKYLVAAHKEIVEKTEPIMEESIKTPSQNGTQQK